MSVKEVCQLHCRSSQPPTEMQRPLLVMLHACYNERSTKSSWNPFVSVESALDA